jgi:hypothetical protein
MYVSRIDTVVNHIVLQVVPNILQNTQLPRHRVRHLSSEEHNFIHELVQNPFLETRRYFVP